jgi:hypothetical protein
MGFLSERDGSNSETQSLPHVFNSLPFGVLSLRF